MAFASSPRLGCDAGNPWGESRSRGGSNVDGFREGEPDRGFTLAVRHEHAHDRAFLPEDACQVPFVVHEKLDPVVRAPLMGRRKSVDASTVPLAQERKVAGPDWRRARWAARSFDGHCRPRVRNPSSRSRRRERRTEARQRAIPTRAFAADRSQRRSRDVLSGRD